MADRLEVNVTFKVNKKVLKDEIRSKIKNLEKSKSEFLDVFTKIYEMGLNDGVEVAMKCLEAEYRNDNRKVQEKAC